MHTHTYIYARTHAHAHTNTVILMHIIEYINIYYKFLYLFIKYTYYKILCINSCKKHKFLK